MNMVYLFSLVKHTHVLLPSFLQTSIIQSPSLLCSAPSSAWTSPLTCRSCQRSPSLGESVGQERAVRGEGTILVLCLLYCNPHNATKAWHMMILVHHRHFGYWETQVHCTFYNWCTTVNKLLILTYLASHVSRIHLVCTKNNNLINLIIFQFKLKHNGAF